MAVKCCGPVSRAGPSIVYTACTLNCHTTDYWAFPHRMWTHVPSSSTGTSPGPDTGVPVQVMYKAHGNVNRSPTLCSLALKLPLPPQTLRISKQTPAASSASKTQFSPSNLKTSTRLLAHDRGTETWLQDDSESITPMLTEDPPEM